MIHKFLSLFIGFCFAFYGLAQITFRVKAPTKSDINGQIRVQFELNGAEGSNFRQPALNDFDILAGPNISTANSVVIINNRTQTTSSTVYTYILAPKRNGTLQIGGASVHAQGKVYQTRPVSILISGKSSLNASTPTASSHSTHDIQNIGTHIGLKDIYFTAEVSKKKIYEQEPIMLTYRYHVREGVAVVNIMPTGKPEMKGFWTQEVELPRNLSPRATHIGGKLYRVGTNLQYLIFPQQSGTLTIPALAFRTDVVQRNSSIDEIDAFFNGGNSVNVSVERSTPPVTLEVVPLPQPQPTNFSGGVGQLSISASLTTPVPKTNDVATLRVVVRGTGNLKLVKAPNVVFPKGFDAYAPKINDKVKITSSGVEGSMEFDYTFVPRNMGKFTIPSISLNYFDPQLKSYLTTSSKAITLDIKKGTKAYAPISSAKTEDLRAIEQSNHRFSTDGFLWIGSWKYWCLLACLLSLSVLGSRYAQKLLYRHLDSEGRKERNARKRAHQRLQQVEKLISSDRNSEFYDALSNAVTGYFAEKFKLEKAALTQQIIRERMAAHRIDTDLIDEALALLSEIDFGQFAPTSENIRQDLYQRSSHLLTLLNDSLR